MRDSREWPGDRAPFLHPPTECDVRSDQTLHAVVVIPVFNHADAVTGVLSRVAALGLEVVVVDDGSTDGTPARLAACQAASVGASVQVLTHRSNLGKAAALRTGFERAAAMGATHVVTIDADGQLDPEDIPRLLEEAGSWPRALILGRRPEQMENCPARCIVGRRNASLAVLAQTGLRLSDTQCGLRVYPLELFRDVRCRAARYAFEAEVITRAAWAGYEVREVPVDSRYFTGEDRVSHWKPWRDSIGQGAVHLRLLAAALLRWSPRNSSSGTPDDESPWYRRLLGWLNPMRSWREVRKEATGDLELASGLALGAWIGTLPFFGLHTIMSVFVAWRLHQHPAAVVLGSQVSTPPFGVVLAAGSITLGHFLLTGSLLRVDPGSLTWASVWQIPLSAFAEWLLGSMVLGVFVATVVYCIGLWIARRVRRSGMLLGGT